MANAIRNERLSGVRRRATSDAILEVATGLLREDGAAAVTVNEVARRLGIRPPSLYTHVSGKDAILDALFLQEAAALWQSIEQAGRIEEPVARLLAMGRAYYEWAMANKRSYQLLFERPLPAFVPSPEALEMNTHGRRLVERTLREIAPDVDAEAAALLRWSMLHGVCSLQIANTPDAGAYEGPFGAVAARLTQEWIPAWLDALGRGVTTPQWR